MIEKLTGKKKEMTLFVSLFSFTRTAALLARGSSEQIVFEPEDRHSIEYLSYNLHRALDAGAETAKKLNWSKYGEGETPNGKEEN
jgi:hypothetical protein